MLIILQPLFETFPKLNLLNLNRKPKYEKCTCIKAFHIVRNKGKLQTDTYIHITHTSHILIHKHVCTHTHIRMKSSFYPRVIWHYFGPLSSYITKFKLLLQEYFVQWYHHQQIFVPDLHGSTGEVSST